MWLRISGLKPFGDPRRDQKSGLETKSLLKYTAAGRVGFRIVELENVYDDYQTHEWFEASAYGISRWQVLILQVEAMCGITDACCRPIYDHTPSL